MRPKKLTFAPVAVDADGICESQTTGGAANLTIDGAFASGGVATLDFARQIGITSDADDSGNAFTITGTDSDGQAQTETIATGPNAATVESTKYFLTVTIVAIDGATVGNITVGTVDEFVSQTIPLDHRSDIGANFSVDIAGTVNFTVQEAFEPLNNHLPTSKPQQDVHWSAITGLSGANADSKAAGLPGATAARLVVNSHSAGATLAVTVVQALNY